MNAAAAVRLATPTSGADRGRFALIAGATAAAGALLMAALHILRLPSFDSGSPGQADAGLANYVTEGGLRGGVVIATLLLTVPVFALAVQALRVGSVARDRRMASLRLAGATPRDVRMIAAAEAGGAALAGGLLAGPAYVLLWVVAGVLPPQSARMLAAPDAFEILAWAGVIALAALAGAVAGAAIHGRAVVEPLGVRRRARPAAPGRASRGMVFAGVVLVVVALSGLQRASTQGGGESFPFALALLGVLLAAFASGPRLVLACSRVLNRRHGAEGLIADRRLQADPRTAGRVAGVLFVCGMALGIESLLVAGQLFDSSSGDVDVFYFAGYGMATAVVLVGAAVALLTLLVGAADGLLDARRPLAALSALGVDEKTLERVLARQLSTIAVPTIVAGALVGGPGIMGVVGIVGDPTSLGGMVQGFAPAFGTALVAGLAMALVARLAARLLRPMMHAAIDPENLRTA